MRQGCRHRIEQTKKCCGRQVRKLVRMESGSGSGDVMELSAVEVLIHLNSKVRYSTDGGGFVDGTMPAIFAIRLDINGEH